MSDSAIPERRVVVVGAAGMLGHTLLRFLEGSPGIEVRGTVRASSLPPSLPQKFDHLVSKGVDATSQEQMLSLLEEFSPDAVINCAGLVKQRDEGQEPEPAIIANALLPHRLARICATVGARLVHISTDCVFSGATGNYREESLPDCTDIYGRTKLLGEVTYGDAVTLRTSIIGPELDRGLGLVSWFLAQTGSVKGYTKAIFSGLPTVELARVIRDYVLPNRELCGLFHVSGTPISKYDLLVLLRSQYGVEVDIVRDDVVRVDRSLDSSRFRRLTRYTPPAWPELVAAMKAFG